MLYFRLQVVEIKPETSDTVTLCFKQPVLKKIKYLPGQYLTLIFQINGRKYIRPYSFSSAPGVDQYLEVTVKRVRGGIVSNYIYDFVKVGDWIEVMPPMGDFIFDTDKINPGKHIFLWGAGSGITPLISIVKYILFTKTGNKVKLIYGNRNMESIIFLDTILNIEKQFKNDIKTWHFHSQSSISKDNINVIEGRIKPEIILSVMEQEVELKHTLHYICGPLGLKESVKTVLKSMSVPDENIFSEDFEIVKNTADFEDINTQIVEIIKDGNARKVEVTKGRSILNAGLDALIDLDYSCQTGTCLLCKAKILHGNVKMIGLKDAEDKLGNDECLMCCGYPLSNDVQISI
jgi:ring-1,2-phenylacetyl-CoA epoxidase subunit PaaE